MGSRENSSQPHTARNTRRVGTDGVVEEEDMEERGMASGEVERRRWKVGVWRRVGVKRRRGVVRCAGTEVSAALWRRAKRALICRRKAAL